MGIDELLNFIESKDNKNNNSNSNKKNKKKANDSSNKMTKKTEKVDNDKISDSKSDINYDDNEFEQFKSKLIGDSIEAGVVTKIKPIFTPNWD